MGDWQDVNTYGKMFNKASVIPRPARNTGVRPILGLIIEPTNGPIGDSYAVLPSELAKWSEPGVLTPDTGSSSRSRVASMARMVLIS